MRTITAPTKEALIAAIPPDAQIVRIIAKRGSYTAQIVEERE